MLWEHLQIKTLVVTHRFETDYDIAFDDGTFEIE
jgi:hypothetical protein